MASNDEGGAQVLKTCDLCEKDTDIRYKCMDCNKFLCERCKGIHKNVPTLSLHDICDLKSELLCPVITKVRMDNILCNYHKKFQCMFCKDCEVLVCSECISNFHQKHCLESLEKTCEEKLSKLERYKAEIGKDVVSLQKSYSDLAIAKTKWENSLDDIRSKIDDKEDELKEAVTKNAAKLRDDLTEKRRNGIEYILIKQKRFKEMEHKLNSKLEILKTMQSSARGEIFAFEQQVMNYPTSGISENIIPRNEIKYLERSTSEETISALFGSMYLLGVPYTMNITIDRSLTTNFSNIENLVVSDGETAWVSTFENNEASVQKMHLTEMFETLKQLTLHAFDMAFTENNDLLISIQSTSEIMRVSFNCELESLLDVSPLIVKAIHVTKNGEFYVGVRESGDPFELTESSCRKILVYKSSDGKQSSLTSNVSYEYDQSKQRLFTSPCRITTISDGDVIIVGDWITHIEGRLVVLNRNGDLEWIYNGNSKINSDKSKFRPYDIVSSPEGYIVVADKNNHAIHLLNGAGELIACKLLDEIGITLPKSLCFDYWGYLWIGCSTFPQDKSGAKIYAVKLSI
ncbi:uncharacterized protein LOC127701636 [Mytilus californianus]|uniref:uncharacterized protein LOC127701636 n=1 Tax=Mytilus californianus TaxID=6549 RepID=UPI0022454D7C|nr:uncharacterized protein LOC127701636 [Mytilus californianus]